MKKCYSNDLLAGQTGDYIAKNLYSAHELLHTTVQDEYYNNGKFIQLYSKAFSNSRLTYLERKTGIKTNT